MKFILYWLIVLLLFSCAAIGPATGGPEDKIGPQLINSYPLTGSINVSTNQKIQYNH